MRRPIALLGMRCAGKTTVGRELARRLRRPFVDLDDETLRMARWQGSRAKSAGELLASAGALAFRGFEAQALRRVLEPSLAIVLATGGGVVERSDNRGWLTRAAFRVWLDVPVDVLAARLAADPTPRPPLTGADAVDEIARVLARRAPHYRTLADLILPGDDDAGTLAGRIVAALD